MRTGDQTVAGASFKTPSLGEAKKLVQTWLVDGISHKQALSNYTRFCANNGTQAPKKTAWGNWLTCVNLSETEEYALARASADFDTVECGLGHMIAFLEKQQAEQAKKAKSKPKQPKLERTPKPVRSANTTPAQKHVRLTSTFHVQVLRSRSASPKRKIDGSAARSRSRSR